MKKLLLAIMVSVLACGNVIAQETDLHQEKLEFAQQACRNLARPVYFALMCQKQGKSASQCMNDFEQGLQEFGTADAVFPEDMKRVFAKSSEIAALLDKETLTEQYARDQERLAYSHCMDGYLSQGK